MRRLWLSVTVLGILVSGCVSRPRTNEYTKTTTRHPDGTVEETLEVLRKSNIKAMGYKLALDKFNVEESYQEGGSSGPGDSTYKVNSDGAKADPASQALKAFQSGAQAALAFYGRDGGISPELSDRLEQLEQGLADLATVAEAVRNQGTAVTNTP